MGASIWSPGEAISASGSVKNQAFIASAAQVLFDITTFTYAVGTGSLAVYVGGLAQRPGIDFTETSISSFTLDTAVAEGTIVLAVAQTDITSELPVVGVVVDAAAAVFLATPTAANFRAAVTGDSGTVIQTVEATPVTAYSNTAASIPIDDTIPQITEGTELITVTITPQDATSRLEIECNIASMATSGSTATVLALFQDAIADAIAVATTETTTGIQKSLSLRHEMLAGTTAAITFSVRIGPAGGTLYLNGTSTGRKFGGIAAIRMKATELNA